METENENSENNQEDKVIINNYKWVVGLSIMMGIDFLVEIVIAITWYWYSKLFMYLIPSALIIYVGFLL